MGKPRANFKTNNHYLFENPDNNYFECDCLASLYNETPGYIFRLKIKT